MLSLQPFSLASGLSSENAKLVHSEVISETHRSHVVLKVNKGRHLSISARKKNKL